MSHYTQHIDEPFPLYELPYAHLDRLPLTAKMPCCIKKLERFLADEGKACFLSYIAVHINCNAVICLHHGLARICRTQFK